MTLVLQNMARLASEQLLEKTLLATFQNLGQFWKAFALQDRAQVYNVPDLNEKTKLRAMDKGDFVLHNGDPLFLGFRWYTDPFGDSMAKSSGLLL